MWFAVPYTMDSAPEGYGIESGEVCKMRRPTGLIVALMLCGSLCSARSKPKKVNFDEVLGMPVITVQTSRGRKRFVLDTGSSISTMDVKTEKTLSVSVAGKRFTVRFKPTQTEVFDEFRAMLPPTERVDGILGSDFMRHFHHVVFDFKGSLISFE
jgi:hypothetical protein